MGFVTGAPLCVVLLGLVACRSMRNEGRQAAPPSRLPEPLPALLKQRLAGRDHGTGTLESPAPAPESEVRPPSDYVETIPSSGVQFDMVWVQAGGFWIGRTEVTWDEYLVFCDFDEEDRPPVGADAVSRPSKPLETFPYDREWGTGRRPAVGMSWNAARRYCEWLSGRTGRAYRLPTEAEWELACGEAPEDLAACAWFDANSSDRTQEVGLLKPNRYGLHDLLGNLWEYTLDPYDPAEPEWAALRGGSWADPAEDASPTARLRFDEFWNMLDSNYPPGVWWVPDGDHLGFRVLRPLEVPSGAIGDRAR